MRWNRITKRYSHSMVSVKQNLPISRMNLKSIFSCRSIKGNVLKCPIAATSPIGQSDQSMCSTLLRCVRSKGTSSQQYSRISFCIWHERFFFFFFHYSHFHRLCHRRCWTMYSVVSVIWSMCICCQTRIVATPNMPAKQVQWKPLKCCIPPKFVALNSRWWKQKSHAIQNVNDTMTKNYTSVSKWPIANAKKLNVVQAQTHTHTYAGCARVPSMPASTDKRFRWRKKKSQIIRTNISRQVPNASGKIICERVLNTSVSNRMDNVRDVMKKMRFEWFFSVFPK